MGFRFLKEKLRMNTSYAQLEALQYFTNTSLINKISQYICWKYAFLNAFSLAGKKWHRAGPLGQTSVFSLDVL